MIDYSIMDFPENSLSNTSHQYAFRMPSPPRIFVPPPIQTSIDSPATQSGRLSVLQPRTIWPNTTFLSEIQSLKNPRIRDYVVDWSYGERQTAQEILPFLFLGPLAAARDKTFLQSKQITMVLGVRRIMDAFMLNPRAPRDLGLEMQFVDTKTEADLLKSFTELATKVNDHLERRFHITRGQLDPGQPPGRILVFCESGNERSATIVAAYIMTIYNVNVVEAIQIVQGQRFCVNIDDAARTRLETYGSMLKAQIDVLEASQGHQESKHQALPKSAFLQVSSNGIGRKRSIERVLEDGEDHDMIEMSVNGNESFKREGSAPFFDEGTDD